MAPVRCRRKSSRPVEARTFAFTLCGWPCFRVTTRTRPAASPEALDPAVLAISTIRKGARASHLLKTIFRAICARHWQRCRRGIRSASGSRGGRRFPQVKVHFGMRSCFLRPARTGIPNRPGLIGGQSRLAFMARASPTSRRDNSCAIKSRAARSSRIGLPKREKG